MNNTTVSDTHNVRDRILALGRQIIGAKGFSAVGLKEILDAAGVPKGSFYHYFGSKEEFGEALLEAYFLEYLHELDIVLGQPDLTMAQKLTHYWCGWQHNQSFQDCQGKCLAVKLGAEVADLSEPMRLSLQRGTSQIVERLAHAIEKGVAEGSISIEGLPQDVAQSLYQLWLGASIMVKIVRHTQPFDKAMATTRQMLKLPD